MVSARYQRRMDPAANFTRLDPVVVDALLGGLEQLLDRPMRAGDSDRSRQLFL